MTAVPRRRRWWAWGIGAGVLVALGASVAAMLKHARLPSRITPSAGTPAEGGRTGAPSLGLQRDAASPRSDEGPTVRGIVRLPNGQPAPSATVSVHRALSAWPEWRSERLDEAITRSDGTFAFRLGDVTGLLIKFGHASYAGDLVEVPRHGGLDLRLEPAFELSGFVTTDGGAPLAGARVALESPSGDRRVEVWVTQADGRYAFKNLRGGLVRVVARHEAWQPISYPAVVVGDQTRIDLPFERPAMSPLRGRVTSAATQAPIADALVQLLPVNGKLGLVDPVETRSGADGAFLLSGLARGNMKLIVRHPDHGAVLRSQTVGIVATDLQVELPLRSAVNGQLVASGSTERWRGVELLQIHDEAGQVEHTVIGPDGRFRFAAKLSPGWANLRLLEPHFAFLRTGAAEVAVRIEEGASTEIDLDVVPPAIVRGRVVDEAGAPLSGVVLVRTRLLAEDARTIGDAAFNLRLGQFGSQVVQLFGTDRDEPLATTGKDGSFTIRGLQTGPLLLRTVAPDYGSRLLRMDTSAGPQSFEVGDVTLERACRLQGTVQRGGRPLAGAPVLVFGPDTQASAVAGADGSWAVDALVPGTYRVRVRLPSQPGGGTVHEVRVTAGGPPVVLPIVVDAGRTVRGAVIGSDGQPVAGAIVTVRGAVGQTTATDGNGDFAIDLPERDVDLQVSLADRSRATLVPVIATQPRVAVRLDTPPTCTLTAQVTSLPLRTRVASALLRLTALDGDGGERVSRWLELPNGELNWSLAPTGRVRIEIWCDGFAPFVVEQVLAANAVHRLGEVLLEPGAHLRGVVRDDRGGAVANALVLLGEETDLELFEAKTRTAADGSFDLGGVTHRSSRLVVRATGFAARVVDLALPRDVLAAPIDVALELGSTIQVDVARGQASEGDLVQLRRDGLVVATTELDEGRRAWFANRSAGVYTVQLVGREGVPKRVDVAAGKDVVRVALP